MVLFWAMATSPIKKEQQRSTNFRMMFLSLLLCVDNKTSSNTVCEMMLKTQVQFLTTEGGDWGIEA